MSTFVAFLIFTAIAVIVELVLLFLQMVLGVKCRGLMITVAAFWAFGSMMIFFT